MSASGWSESKRSRPRAEPQQLLTVNSTSELHYNYEVASQLHYMMTICFFTIVTYCNKKNRTKKKYGNLINNHQQPPTNDTVPSPASMPPVYDWNVVTPRGFPVVHHRVVPIDCDQHCADRICTAFVVLGRRLNHFKNGWPKKIKRQRFEYEMIHLILGGAGLR